METQTQTAHLFKKATRLRCLWIFFLRRIVWNDFRSMAHSWQAVEADRHSVVNYAMTQGHASDQEWEYEHYSLLVINKNILLVHLDNIQDCYSIWQHSESNISRFPRSDGHWARSLNSAHVIIKRVATINTNKLLSDRLKTVFLKALSWSFWIIVSWKNSCRTAVIRLRY